MNKTTKKVLSLALCLCMPLFASSALAEYADGSYTGVGTGMGGDVNVSVTVEGGKIVSVEVGEHNETPGISDPAIEQIPAAIVEAQSADVEAVSGATVTSNAIKEAVKAALSGEQAEEEGVVIPFEQPDVIVIGAGMAGLSSAVRASQLGANVLVFEQMPRIGGSAAVAGGSIVGAETIIEKEAGIEEGVNLTVLFDNAQADTATASMISDNYVSQKVDLICAIATPSAMSAYNSCMDSDIPVIYTAVSDPVSAGLAKEDKTPEGNITGTADTLPVEAQLKMIREVLPDATKIGILYTTSEANSLSTIETYKELAGDYGFEIVESGINTLADVDMAAADLAAKVDCISNLTDNTVVQGLQTVLAKASAAGIPVFGSEVEQVKNGCLAAEGIDYVALGKQTGAMAAKVLKGEAEASDMPYEACEGANLYINTEVASDLGITFPENYETDAAEVFETVTVE